MNLIDFFDDIDLNQQTVNTKVCSVCSIEKPLSSFHKRSGGTYDGRCGACKNKYQKELKYVKDSVHTPPMPQYCDCCGRENPKITGKGLNLALDHSYDANGNPIFRGWLCKQCNSGIGYLGDNIEGVFKAVDYLLKSLPEDKSRKFFSMIKLEKTITEKRMEKLNGCVQGSDSIHSSDQEECSRR